MSCTIYDSCKEREADFFFAQVYFTFTERTLPSFIPVFPRLKP
jgi:hypothetical protein